MGVQSADPVAAANGSKVKRPWSIKAYVVGLVAVFVLASGSALVALAGTNQLSGGLIAITLTGPVVFLAAGLVFSWRIARPIAEVSAAVPATERMRVEADHPAQEHRQHECKRLQSLGQMAGAVAPDLNNLLAIIMKHADFLAEKTAGRPAAQADVQRIRVAAQRAAQITRQLLVVGRRETAHPETLELNTIVAHIADLLPASVGADIEIHVEAAADLPAIEADRGQVEQVILNLAVNARDAMPQGGTLTIETGLAELDERHVRRPAVSAGRYVELTVSDTGTGMSADFAAHIFEPLFTTKPVGQGNGLGLATVHAIVAGAGGSISVFSEEGTGTTLRLLFPAAGTAAPAGPTADLAEREEPGRRSSLSTMSHQLH
jgi:two-component system, cell cycle sensor histidine kinase and response regulator CckA